jgi:hypothetical protein
MEHRPEISRMQKAQVGVRACRRAEARTDGGVKKAKRSKNRLLTDYAAD